MFLQKYDWETQETWIRKTISNDNVDERPGYKNVWIAVFDVKRSTLRKLLRAHALRKTCVHVNGFEECLVHDEAIFKAKIDGLREIAAKIGEAKSLGADVTEVEREHRNNLLQVGAVGRLILDLVALPLEEEEAYEAASGLEPDKIEARQDAQVRQLNRKVCFVILGGANDLSDNILPGTEYVRIATSEWKRCLQD